MIPMQFALRRRMMVQGKGNGPWTVTVDGEWGLWYWKERLTGNNIIVNGVSLFADYTSTSSYYPVRTVSQQYTVNNGDIITLIIGIEDEAYVTSKAGIWIDDVKVVSVSEVTSYTYEMVVNSDCRITGVIPTTSTNEAFSDMPNNGAIKVYTEV